MLQKRHPFLDSTSITCCEILLIFLPFGTIFLSASFNFCHTTLFMIPKWMSLHREIEAWQYADCRSRTQACQHRVILIHEHMNGGANKIDQYACVKSGSHFAKLLFCVESRDISMHLFMNEAHWLESCLPPLPHYGN